MSAAIGPARMAAGPSLAILRRGGGVGRVLQPVCAGDDPGSVGMAEIGDHVRRRGLGRVAGDQARQAGADDEAVVGEGLGLAEQGRPGKFAVRFVGHGEHGYRHPEPRPSGPESTASENDIGLPSAPRKSSGVAPAGAVSRPS